MYLLKLNRKGDALVYDYESPYRHYSENERVKAVSKDLYDTYNWKGVKDATLRTACDKYNELQFDPLDEQLIAFNKKINQFTSLIDSMHLDEENAELLQKLMIGVEKILKTRQSLLDAIDRRGERQKIAGDKGLSFLERRKEIKEM